MNIKDVIGFFLVHPEYSDKEAMVQFDRFRKWKAVKGTENEEAFAELVRVLEQLKFFKPLHIHQEMAVALFNNTKSLHFYWCLIRLKFQGRPQVTGAEEGAGDARSESDFGANSIDLFIEKVKGELDGAARPMKSKAYFLEAIKLMGYNYEVVLKIYATSLYDAEHFIVENLRHMPEVEVTRTVSEVFVDWYRQPKVDGAAANDNFEHGLHANALANRKKVLERLANPKKTGETSNEIAADLEMDVKTFRAAKTWLTERGILREREVDNFIGAFLLYRKWPLRYLLTIKTKKNIEKNLFESRLREKFFRSREANPETMIFLKASYLLSYDYNVVLEILSPSPEAVYDFAYGFMGTTFQIEKIGTINCLVNREYKLMRQAFEGAWRSSQFNRYLSD